MKQFKNLNKIYNPKDFEKKLYQYWEKHGYFKENNSNKNNYCIIMPPPNITGNLHIGHALQQTIMDILIRFQRMQGKNTLWQPGMDHAGIATQILIEKKILKEKKHNLNHTYTKKEFLKKTWQWKKTSHSIISNQIKRLGSSVNWDKERFTMDKKSSQAVKKAFLTLYKHNLIYQGTKIVHWDTKLQTAISDLETEHKNTQGTLWYLQYPIYPINTNNALDYVVVATTRPETIFGDTGIAINPKDTRYKKLTGKFVKLPLIDRIIPIIKDSSINMNQGTGCVKITPAHDFNDYKIGIKNNLPIVNIFTKNGKIRKKPEIFQKDTNTQNYQQISYKIPKIFHNLDRFAARKLVIKQLKTLGLIKKSQKNNTTVPYSSKTNTIVEPMITKQWYIRISKLANTAIKVVQENKIQFIPEKYRKIYFHWMHNIQDWCISRQLWWGHKLPIWYDNQNKIYAGYNERYIRKKYNLSQTTTLHQENDVLDTWFSSGLWTFSSLGWPQNTKTFKKFHPTDIIVSGFDIIFFWIARMIMLTTYLLKNKHNKETIPFKQVYITGIIKDANGEKMSKSKGNIIDPVDIIDGISLKELIKKHNKNINTQHNQDIKKSIQTNFPNGIQAYGADTLRLTLTSLTSKHHNIRWDMKKLTGYKNFCNKLWNASKFVLINTHNQDYKALNETNKKFSKTDLWIITKLNKTIKKIHNALNHYRFDLATEILYEFTWHQFCDWYIEFAKFTIKYEKPQKISGTKHTLITTLEKLLRLLHPIIPFITEKIWQKTKTILNIPKKTIMLQPFPIYNKNQEHKSEYEDIEWIKKNISAIRTVRSEMHIKNTVPLELFIQNTTYKIKKRITENLNYIKKLAKLKNIILLKPQEKGPKSSIIKLIENTELFIPIKNILNKNIETQKINKQIRNIQQKIDNISNKLNQTHFSKKAPKKIIEQEKTKLTLYQKQIKKFLKQKKILFDL
ncbi:MAG: valine--tRNA ligase [Candidatus Westeberhardia cardiocondylae]|nr:valine--tRNA ligase [Candidatus Westeberhardia cardiocondylae]